MEERLQKILSQAGICSRRRAEEYLTQGRVWVNGAPAALGDKAVLGQDLITLDGVPVAPLEKKTYLMLNKPRGYVSTLSDEQGRKTVANLVEDCGVRVWPVGRLDMDSEGLLILCNDGALTNGLLHPSHMVEKEYHVRVQGDVAAAIPVLTAPMMLDGDAFLPARVRILREEGETALVSMVIREGKNRQIRRMCAQGGLRVLRLKRVREGKLMLDPSLQTGRWRFLHEKEILVLQDAKN
ncbi:MAG: Ribosomal large subunit pseudouridine synthase [Firmicutes bacterium]|nr:Ribosomal large subunit pseudouridine synthase [Bacillota bacterium]